MVVLTALVGPAIGLLMGTTIKPEQIGLMFTLIFRPLLFTGCTYYPFAHAAVGFHFVSLQDQALAGETVLETVHGGGLFSGFGFEPG